MPERCLAFECGGEQLLGILHQSDAGARELGVLIVVGGPQYRVGSHRQFVLMARDIAAGGYPVLRFDYRGMGDSSGPARTFESVAEDIAAAMSAMNRELPGLDRFVLLGLCDAASAALMCCASDERVAGLVLINPWVRTETGAARTLVRHYYVNRLFEPAFWLELVRGKIPLGEALHSLVSVLRKSLAGETGASARHSRHFLERMLDGMRAFRGPVLLQMSGRDLTAREFEDLCRQDEAWSAVVRRPQVARVDLASADHTFSARDDLRLACEAVLDWLGKHWPRQPGNACPIPGPIEEM